VLHYKSLDSVTGSVATMMRNRVGDIFLVWFLSLLVLDEVGVLPLVALLLASITKRAQIPFSAWLPLAIAAPTPISALVHSRTLVTAGIILLIKREKPYSLLLFILGIVTMSLARLKALVEEDLKKVVALSTLSQLGLMVVSFSIGLYLLMFIHLLSHSLFKSLLFLEVGVVIHTDGGQDSRGLKLLPVSKLVLLFMALTVLNLSGLAYTSGMISKDLLLERNLSYPFNLLSFIFLLVVVLTILYSYRILSSLSKINTPLATLTRTRGKSVFSSLLLFLLSLTFMIGFAFNFLDLPPTILGGEKILFLLYLSVVLLFLKVYSASPFPLGIGVSVLLMGKSSLFNLKFTDRLGLSKDRILYYSLLSLSYSNFSKLGRWFLFFCFLLLIL